MSAYAYAYAYADGCVRGDEIHSLTPPTQVNAKLAGVNHTLRINRNPDILASPVTMIFGLDITHPKPGSQHPTLSAVRLGLWLCVRCMRGFAASAAMVPFLTTR